MHRDHESEKSETRRQAMQKMAYMAPIVATMVAAPAFAQTGSSRGGRRRRPLPRVSAEVPSDDQTA